MWASRAHARSAGGARPRDGRVQEAGIGCRPLHPIRAAFYRSGSDTRKGTSRHGLAGRTNVAIPFHNRITDDIDYVADVLERLASAADPMLESGASRMTCSASTSGHFR